MARFGGLSPAARLYSATVSFSSGTSVQRVCMFETKKPKAPKGALWTSRIVSAVVHGRFVILFSTLISIVGVLLYLNLARPTYEVRGMLAFADNSQANQNVVSGVAAANYLEQLSDAARSDEVLAGAVRRLDLSQLGIIGIGSDAVQSLRHMLKIQTSIANDELDIRLDSPFPHQAAKIVNAVLASLASATKTDAATGRTTQLIDPTTVAQCDLASGDVAPDGLTPVEMISIAGACGAILAFFTELVFGSAYQQIRSPGQILERTGLRTAGHLPILPERSAAGRGLATYIDPSSEGALLYRSLLLNLFGANVSRQAGSLLVTSPYSGEGSSTVAVNLATTIAMTGESVLLIDVNFARPVLHKIFGDNNPSPGFYDGLDNPHSVREFIRPTHIENLHLLPCGKPSSVSAAKLQSSVPSDILKQLTGLYRYVMFDGGPALGNPDTAALAARCRATLLVLHATRSSLSAAAQCHQILKSYGAKQMVAIVNALPRASYRKYFQSAAIPSPSRLVSHQLYRDINEFGLSAS